MPLSICREWEGRSNENQYTMFSYNGFIIEEAEDCVSGVVHIPTGYDVCITDWSEEGLIVPEHPHPGYERLHLARAFFDMDSSIYNPTWRFYEQNDPGGVLAKYTTMSLLIYGVVRRHLKNDPNDPRPLVFGVVKALRDLQAVLGSPTYTLKEFKKIEAPSRIAQDFLGLPEQSARRLSAGSKVNLFEHAVNLELVADFLIARRAKRAWHEFIDGVRADRACKRALFNEWCVRIKAQQVKRMNEKIKRKLDAIS
jgi:hypothetical protein